MAVALAVTAVPALAPWLMLAALTQATNHEETVLPLMGLAVGGLPAGAPLAAEAVGESAVGARAMRSPAPAPTRSLATGVKGGGRGGANIPQKYRSEVGTPRSNPHVQRTLDDINAKQLHPRRDPFENRHQLLPEGNYEYYNVTRSGEANSDWRIVHEKNADRWYFSGNFHQAGGTGATFVEIIDPFLR
jgi:hypothetical protein